MTESWLVKNKWQVDVELLGSLLKKGASYSFCYFLLVEA